MTDHLESPSFMPHGMCYLWQPDILALHVISDSLITLAYFSIPFTLLYFVRKRTDLQFNWIFVCFAIFIVACGTTHLMEVWTIWHPTYWVSGIIKAITAAASVPTAILLVKLIPEALQLPNPSALHALNRELAHEITERENAEREIRRINEQLGVRVAERTAELEAANQNLLRDISRRERAEMALRESEDRFRTLTESLPHLVWTSRPDGFCDYLSRQWTAYTGLHESQQLGYGVGPQVDPADRERVEAEWGAALVRGDEFDSEYRIRRADGVSRWFRVRAVPLRDGAGNIIKWFGTNTDIEEYKLADQRLRSQLERLALLDRTTRAIGERQDPHSIQMVVLRSLEDELPIDFGCVCLRQPARGALNVVCVGAKSQALAHQLDMPEQTEIEIDQNGLSRCLRGQLVYERDLTRAEFPFPRRLAGGGLGSLVIAPLAVESKIFGVVVAARRGVGQFSSTDCEFLRQVSEHLALALHQADLYRALQRAYDDLRQTQQNVMQQERLRALGQMASGIAHDINNALSPAALYVQMLLERDPTLSSDAKGYLDVVQRAIDDVAQTVARMREFSRRREPQLLLASLDLNRVIQQVIELTRARWNTMPQERGMVIQLQTDLAADLPPLAGLESEIRDAVTNLILNAVDAMPHGGILTLRTRTVAPDRVQIEVADTGVGMDETTRARCLEPFFTTKGERGTGLGLAMVYGMVERHNGELQIDSELGKGTRVRLQFPAAVPTDAVGEGTFRTPAPAQALRILFVDDDPIMLKSLSDTLGQDGHSVVLADGGQRAIDTFRAALARGEHFDAVITDLGMPHVDGRTVAAAIKAAAPRVPVVMLTGWGHRLLAENDTPPCVDRVLSKPPRLAALRLALAELALAGA
jgi:PAS domain S-box-containing protein